MPPRPYTLGLDIGGTSLKCACVGSSGEVLLRETTPLDAQDAHWTEQVRERLRRIEQDLGPAAHVGLAAPGIAAPDGSSIWWMQGRLGEVQGLHWPHFLERPVVPVLNVHRPRCSARRGRGPRRGA